MSVSFEPVPMDLDQVLQPTWLTAALGQRYAGCEVATVTVLTTLSTIASKVRLELSYAAPGVPAAPRNVYVKGYFGDKHALAAAGIPEARFYSDLAPSVDSALPDCHYVGFDEDTGRSLLLLEDLGVRPDTTLRDARSPFTVAEAAATLDELAKLHSIQFDSATLGQEWLIPRMVLMADLVPTDRLQTLIDQPRGDGLPSEIRNGRRVGAAMRALGSEVPSDPCLLHGDTHAGNIFLTGATAGLYDWQVVQRGLWALDVSYHIASVLEVEDRRQNELELLEAYLDRREKLGSPVPDRSAALGMYKRHLAYGLFLWSMTQYTDEALTTITIRRLGHAVADHDTFGLLGV